MRSNLIIFISILSIFIASCSSFKSDQQPINITCNVPDVILRVNGERYDCPANFYAWRDKSLMIDARKTGYDTTSKLVRTHFSTAAKWDLVGAVLFVVPAVGLLSAGAYDLDETDIKINLLPMSQTTK